MRISDWSSDVCSSDLDTADRLIALLAQVDIIEVGFKNRALVEARLDDQRVSDLIEFAAECLRVAEKQTAHQLLGQRTAALTQLAGTQIDPRCAQDAQWIDTAMQLEEIGRASCGERSGRYV